MTGVEFVISNWLLDELSIFLCYMGSASFLIGMSKRFQRDKKDILLHTHLQVNDFMETAKTENIANGW